MCYKRGLHCPSKNDRVPGKDLYGKNLDHGLHLKEVLDNSRSISNYKIEHARGDP